MMSDGSLGRRAYRRMLRLLPRDMRDRFGADMEEVLARRLAEAGGSLPGSAVVWARAVADVMVQAVSLRLGERERGAWRMGSVAQDLRNGVRSALAAPAFSLLAVVTLGLGIGASTATFSVVNAVLLRELPFDEPDRLVYVWPEINANKAVTLLAGERMPSLASVSGMSGWTLTLTGVGEPRELVGMLVFPGFLEMLGLAPELGRSFDAGEDLPGAEGVVVLSHSLWVSAFGADPGVLDRVVDLGGAEHDRRRVVGVMPAGLERLWPEADVWLPLEGDRALGLQADDTWFVNERLARLAPGATLDEANAEVRRYAAEVQRELPGHISVDDAARATVQPVAAYVVRKVSTALWVTLGAVGLVLLIACANVANLLLARGEARGRDLAVRAALGAGRVRLTRMLLAEAGTLGAAGGALGVAAALLLVRLVAALAPPGFPGIDQVSVRAPVLAFALAVTLLSIVGAGLAPALRVGRADATAALGGGARGTAGRSAGKLSPALVGAQVALAVVVVVGSGLMLRSLSTLLSVDPGLDGEGVVAFKPSPPAGRYPDGEAFRGYYAEVVERVAALRGVESVGAIHLLPGTQSNWSFPTFPEGFVVPDGATRPSVNFRAVRGDYFGTTRIPPVSGRVLAATDGADAEPVVVVNEAFVAAYWPGLDPLGRTLSIFSTTGTRYRVVGVVGDVRQHSRAAEPRPEMYFNHDQVPWNQMSLWILARVSSPDPLASAAALREAVWSVDPDVPIAGMAHLADVLGESTRDARFLTLLLSAFGAFALVLCAVGVFGLATYSTGRRRPEFGVRMALGSSRLQVVGAGVGRTLGPVCAGLLLGLVVARLASALLAAVLYTVGPGDPATFAAVAVVLGGVGVVASLVPAWRASRVDPATVLGSE